MGLTGQKLIPISIVLLICLVSGCGGKNIQREVERLNTRLTSLDQRLRAIEQWTQTQTDLPTQLASSEGVEKKESTAELEEKFRQAQIRLHQIENRLAKTDQTQSQLQNLAERLTALESQVGYLVTRNTEQSESVKVPPPPWLHKVIWEENGVVYAVGSSTNKSNGHEFALLNAKNALLEYLGVQTIAEVQVLETYQDNHKTYVLVSKVKAVD